ncbi:MAG: transposase [Proteobacteria bacterium]|nr:transposase [Pseudomonadota bacterium]
MKGKRFSQEKVTGILKEAECKGGPSGDLCRKHGVSEQTVYRWRRTYDGLSVRGARRLKDLEKEYSRLKRRGFLPSGTSRSTS